MCRYQGYLAAHLEHLAECLLAAGRAGEATAAITEAVCCIHVDHCTEAVQMLTLSMKLAGQPAACGAGPGESAVPPVLSTQAGQDMWQGGGL